MMQMVFMLLCLVSFLKLLQLYMLLGVRLKVCVNVLFLFFLFVMSVVMQVCWLVWVVGISFLVLSLLMLMMVNLMCFCLVLGLGILGFRGMVLWYGYLVWWGLEVVEVILREKLGVFVKWLMCCVVFLVSLIMMFELILCECCFEDLLIQWYWEYEQFCLVWKFWDVFYFYEFFQLFMFGLVEYCVKMNEQGLEGF